IVYTIVVRNTGNVTLKDVEVKDGLVDLDELIDKLAPGQSASLSVDYEITQADLDKGQVLNKATVTAKDPDGEDHGDEDEEIVELDINPDLEAKKSGVYVDANGDGKVNVGDRIDYLITIGNTGNITLHNINVLDDMIGLDEHVDELAPGQMLEFTGSYFFNQINLDLGFVYNKLELEVDEIEDPEEPEDKTDLPQVVEISVTKEGSYVDLNSDGVVNVGDGIAYDIYVENTGNVTLVSVLVEDELLELVESIDLLVPGQGKSFEVLYLIKQEEIDEGQVFNLVHAQGEKFSIILISDDDELSELVEAEDSDITLLSHLPLIEVTKEAIVEREEGLPRPGDRVDYKISLINRGNVTLFDVRLEDELLGIDELITTMAPSEELEFTGFHLLDQDDIDAGILINWVSVQAKDKDEEEASSSYFEYTELERESKLKIEKFASLEGDSLSAGDELIYRIRVSNEGNTRLWMIVVEDNLLDLQEEIESLEPGEYRDFIKSYAVTQEDLDRGYVLNLAEASAYDPREEKLEEEVELETPLEANPDIEAIKTAEYVDANGDGEVNVGDRIDYLISIQNTGNITLHGIRIQDPLIGLDEMILSLVPGELVELEGGYFFTQEDLDRGLVVNLILASGLDSKDQEVEDDFELETFLEQTPKLDLKKLGKYVDANGDGKVGLGDEIHYNIILENQGNITLTKIRVVDSLLDIDRIIESLAPGEKITIEGIFRIGQVDLEEGQVLNKVQAKAKELKEPVEAQVTVELKVEKPVEIKKLPPTGSRNLRGLLLISLSLLALAGSLLVRREEHDGF
ncbi:MAG: hypothetical protein GXZ13_07220, partial [Synergistaceae bacterium]|nr:hypothetical protein [Synergistaceae bacterium]